MKLSLAISTCPNDTFMFDALIHKRIDTRGLSFDLQMADIEELNVMAADQVNDITKISFFAFSKLTAHYQMLRSGAAIGFGNGPLIISKHKIYPNELHEARIAIPGENTTANLLLNVLFPESIKKKSYLFSDIEEAVLSGEADAGLIIHETRFSYHKKGLKKVADLGQLWEQKMNLPLPLGGIAIRRSLPDDVKQTVEQLIGDSIKFAFQNPKASYDFVKKHARDLHDEVIRKHIDMYVNNFSIHCMDEGQQAMEFIINEAIKKQSTQPKQPIFLNNENE
ncbi:MAG: 1,4-dihydroxy-6-naphthoate synthase [Salinivirgaceae bacterium]|jgi:1,4-dihydroxy-6-naphthoate synthase|nr:1,4-dihydroxy-6-naphthoate synthase [Salinivirgaceae bacterium]